MTVSMVSAFLHLVGGVLLAGYALFWVVMARGLERDVDRRESTRLLRVINHSRWPPGPAPLRLPMPVLGWLLLGALVVTGVLLVGARATPLDTTGGATDLLADGIGPVFAWKLALFAALVAGHLVATARPRLWIAYVNGTLVLAIVVVSALLRH